MKSMLDHRCTIKRGSSAKTAYGETIPGVSTTVASNIPCRLSQGQRGSNTVQGLPQTEITLDFKLYLSTNIDVRAGDEITVSYQGQSGIFTAGKPYSYREHLEVPLLQEADA